MVIIDKKGCPFEVKSYQPEDYSSLEEMYDTFTPKAKFQGMPPVDQEVRHNWIRKLVKAGDNFLAWQEGKVVGHVVILSDFDKRDAEYLIFVSQANRGRGVGKELTRAALQKAKEYDLRCVWLTVDSFNFRAIRLYKKVGFHVHEESCSASERVMILEFE
ncbi:MAG: GNAT family N-acetyltransferase [Desulfobacterales bacterium]|nr:GNAT family N-acetyltransferase [Desulfobacterales bacterium]